MPTSDRGKMGRNMRIAQYAVALMLAFVQTSPATAQTSPNPQNRIELERLENRGRRNRIWGGVALAVGGVALAHLAKDCVEQSDVRIVIVGWREEYKQECIRHAVPDRIKALGYGTAAVGVSLWNVLRVSATPGPSPSARVTVEW